MHRIIYNTFYALSPIYNVFAVYIIEYSLAILYVQSSMNIFEYNNIRGYIKIIYVSVKHILINIFSVTISVSITSRI